MPISTAPDLALAGKTTTLQTVVPQSDYLRLLSSFVPSLLVNFANGGGLDHHDQACQVTHHCALLFVDISGFTALTEKLAARHACGAETLTTILNAYFGTIIDEIYAHGGDVVKFAGDALLACWLPEESSSNNLLSPVIACALALQGSVQALARTQQEALSIKIAVSVGETRFSLLGGIFDRWELLLAGESLALLGHCNALAEPGDIILAKSVIHHADEIGFHLPSGETVGDHGYRLITPLEPQSNSPTTSIRALLNADKARHIQRFIPGAIRSKLQANMGEWLGERRHLSIIFANLPDLNVQTPLDLAQQTMREVQLALYRFEGSINKISVDDKGTSLVAVLGMPPLIHSDDPERAVLAAQGIEAVLRNQGFACAIGVATGQVFCGVVGNTMRREYTMMGDCVNLAARLMQAAWQLLDADSSRILVDAATHESARTHLSFRSHGSIHVKGKTNALAIFVPDADSLSRRTEEAQAHHDLSRRFFGRENELAQLAKRASDFVKNRHGGVLVVQGELGSGRSSLLRYAAEQAEQHGIYNLRGGGDPIHTQTPFHAWQPVFKKLLLPKMTTREGQQRRPSIAELLAQLPPEPLVLQYYPLLSAVLPGDWPDNEHTKSLDGAARAQKIIALLTRILGFHAQQHPMIIRLLDVQWLDLSSAQLLLQVKSADLPIDLWLTLHPGDSMHSETVQTWLQDDPSAITCFNLGPLDDEALLALAAHAIGVDQLPPPADQLILERAEGSPLYAEQLAGTLLDTGLLKVHEQQAYWNGMADSDLRDLLPDDMERLITARIDRLSPDAQMTIKVASVIGQVFESDAVSWIHPIHRQHDIIARHCLMLDEAALTQKIVGEASRYRFKSQLMMQVTYNMVPAAQRLQLHTMLAQNLEQAQVRDAHTMASLAFHWHRAADAQPDANEAAAKAAGYHLQLAQQAARLGAASESIHHFEQVLKLAPKALGDLIQEQEIQAWLGLSAVRMSLHGWGDERSAEAFERARARCIALEKNELLFKSTRGLWQGYIARADYDRAEQLATDICALTMNFREQNCHTAMLAEARRMVGTTQVWQSRLPQAIEHLQAAIDLLTTAPEDCRQSTTVSLMQDTSIAAYGMLSWAHALNNDHQLASDAAKKALERGLLPSVPPFTQAYALGTAMWTALYLDQPLLALQCSAQLQQLAAERCFDYLWVAADVVHAWAQAQVGLGRCDPERPGNKLDIEKGIANMQAAIERWTAQGQQIGVPAFKLQLARLLWQCGREEDARLAFADEQLRKALPKEPWLNTLAQQSVTMPDCPLFATAR